MVIFRAVTRLALLLPLFTIPVWSISGPSGMLRPDSLGDLAPHPQSSRNYNEFWTYQFRLNDSIQIQVNLSRASFGSFKDPVCGGDFALMGFKGRDYFVAREYKSRNFNFDPFKTRLSVHEQIFFEGRPPQAHRLFFSTVKKGTAYFLDLSFEEMAQGLVWGDGVFHLQDGQRMGLFFHIPKARVHGRIAIDGDTVNVNGSGWMDHTYQTDFATKLIDAGYRFVALPKSLQTKSSVEGGFFFQYGSSAFGYGLREEKDHWTLLCPREIKTVERGPCAGINVARKLEITYEGPSPTRFQREKDRQVNSALQELSRMERFGARFFLGGEIYGCRGTGLINDSLSAIYSFTVIKR